MPNGPLNKRFHFKFCSCFLCGHSGFTNYVLHVEEKGLINIMSSKKEILVEFFNCGSGRECGGTPGPFSAHK